MSSPVINKYLEELSTELKYEKDNFFYAYRGQPSEDDALNCSAARNFDPENKDDKIFLRDIQTKVISDFRLKGFGFSKEKQRKLYDLELLGDLRHYGAPACLIDFTSDFLIALWFASGGWDQDKDKDKNGKVFVLNCYETDKFSVVSSKSIENKVAHFFKDRFKKIWYWVPERLNQRLTDQDAVFIFGKPEIKEYKSIIVKKEDKRNILDELEKFFDYSKKTLFSDRYALGDVYKDFGSSRERPEDCLEEAVYYIQTGIFSKAVTLLNKIINQKYLLDLEDTKNLYLEARFQRAYSEMERIKEEVRDDTVSTSDHFKAISSLSSQNAVEGIDYIEDLQFCIDHKYKYDKIKKIEKEFKLSVAPEPK